MFGIKRKLVSARQKAFKAFRLFGGLEKEDPNVSSPTPVFTVAPYEPVSSITDYALEAELKKAKALAYWHMSDRPK